MHDEEKRKEKYIALYCIILQSAAIKKHFNHPPSTFFDLRKTAQHPTDEHYPQHSTPRWIHQVRKSMNTSGSETVQTSTSCNLITLLASQCTREELDLLLSHQWNADVHTLTQINTITILTMLDHWSLYEKEPRWQCTTHAGYVFCCVWVTVEAASLQGASQLTDSHLGFFVLLSGGMVGRHRPAQLILTLASLNCSVGGW